MSKKADILKTIDEIAESVMSEKEKSKKGRPKKKVEEVKELEINEERFEEERGRIISYFEKMSARKIGPSEIISILYDLEVIEEANGLTKDEIIEKLRERLQTRR